MTRYAAATLLLTGLLMAGCSTERSNGIALDRLDRAPQGFYTADPLTDLMFVEGDNPGPVFCPVTGDSFPAQCPGSELAIERVTIEPGELAPELRPIAVVGPTGERFGIRSYRIFTPGRYAMVGSTVVSSVTTTISTVSTSAVSFGFRPVGDRTVVFDARPGRMVVIGAKRIVRGRGLVPAASDEAVGKVRAALGPAAGDFEIVAPEEVSIDCANGRCRIVGDG